jgi:hypothetical protein
MNTKVLLGCLLICSGGLASADTTGTFEQGLAIGQRNGGLISQRVKLRTVGTEGCGAIPQLEQGLLAVTRNIRGPVDRSDALVAGFFAGYLQAVNQTIAEARLGCNAWTQDDGKLAGSLLGALFCGAHLSQTSAVQSLGTIGFYPGWSGGNAQSIEQCHATLEEVAQGCELVTTEEILGACQDPHPFSEIEVRL